MARGRHRNSSGLRRVRWAGGLLGLALVITAAVLASYAERPSGLRFAVVVALAGAVVFGLLLAGADRTPAEVAAMRAELLALRAAVNQIAEAPALTLSELSLQSMRVPLSLAQAAQRSGQRVLDLSALEAAGRR